MKIILLFLILAGCSTKVLIVCPDSRGIEKCVEDTLKKKVKIVDIKSTTERGVFEVKYR